MLVGRLLFKVFGMFSFEVPSASIIGVLLGISDCCAIVETNGLSSVGDDTVSITCCWKVSYRKPGYQRNLGGELGGILKSPSDILMRENYPP